VIDNDQIQAALVAKLKANTALTTWLSSRSSSDEIREAQYQAAGFLYPAVRVELGTQIEEGNPPCYSTIPFTVCSYSEKNSSQEANQLAGLVADALLRKNVSGSGWHSQLIIADGMIAARRTSERVWQAVNLYRMNIYGGVL
jgi:hypothetical protein